MGSKCTSSDTESNQEVDRKYDKTRVSEGFLQQNIVINCSVCIPLILLMLWVIIQKSVCRMMGKTVT